MFRSAIDNHAIVNVVDNNTNPSSEISAVDFNGSMFHNNNSNRTEICVYLSKRPPIIYVIVALTACIIVVNSIVLYIFLQKKNRSPLTILLSCLAFSDTMTAILFSINNLIVLLSGNYFNQAHITLLKPAEDQGICGAHILLGFLALIFHNISVLLTAALSLQKAVSMVFPIWSKSHLNNKAAMLTSLFAAVFSILLYLPSNLGHFHVGNLRNSYSNSYKFLFIFTAIVASVTYITCVSVVCVCTLIVCCKLTSFRGTVQGIHTPFLRKRNRRAAIIVVCICAIFILSEIIRVGALIFMLSHLFLMKLQPFMYFLQEYDQLSLLVGFSLNFIVYLVMGRHLRDTLMTGLRQIYMRCLAAIRY